jgi:ribosome-associated toxin RatA of RatAB toxin-antitoxin module
VIRKYGRIDAPVELVRDMFLAVEEWPSWMPGVESVEVQRRDDSNLLVRLRQVQLGRRLDQELDCRISPLGMSQRQVSGIFKRWQTQWRFAAPPDGHGTTVSCELDLELRVMGLPAPRARLEAMVDRLFREVISSGQRRARELHAARQQDTAGWPPPGEVLLEVHALPGGLEIRFGGRSLFLEDSE